MTPPGEINSGLKDLKARALKAYFKLKRKLGYLLRQYVSTSLFLFDALIKKILLQYFKKNIIIKYPNDLLVNKKKICGIVQETAFNNNVKYIVIGIGINLIKDPKIKNYPTTNILKETGLKVKKLNLIKNIEKNYIKNLKLFA